MLPRVGATTTTSLPHARTLREGTVGRMGKHDDRPVTRPGVSAVPASAQSVPAQRAPAVRRRRDAAVEALRLFAIAGIAVFHTFQPYFNAYAYQQGGVPTGWIGAGSAFVLGLISLLGAAGNNVFFMISGFYLLPRMRERAGQAGYWRHEARAFGRRAAVIAASVALCLLLGLIAQALGAPLFGGLRGVVGWLTGGLEFIWLYLLALALAPLLAWAGAKAPGVCRAVFCLLGLIVLVLDQWIAFADRGSFSRGLLDWRKLMSGATYLVAFVLAGFMGAHRRRVADLAAPLLSVTLALVVAAEAAAAWRAGHGSVLLLGALAYKSTSLLSFLLAVSLLSLACRQALAHPAERVDEPEPAGPKAVRRLASSILGFYICQSLLSAAWHLFCTRPLASVVVSAGPAVFFLAGICASLLYALVLMGLDLLVRRPLLHLLHLA